LSPSRHTIVLTLLLAPLIWAQSCPADIYQRVDEEGVAWYTDSPQDNRYQAILRERQVKAKAVKQTTPAHLAATGIETRLRPTLSATEPAEGEHLVLPVQGKITSLTGLRHDPIDGKLRHHNGVDIAAATGTPVKPVAPGVVVFSGVRPGYGNMVIVDHQNGTLTVYAHHSLNMVAVGDQVSTGSVIALTGSTGRSTGPHLHFEAWQDGENITRRYIPATGDRQMAAATTLRQVPIRRILQDDGTLLFTNLN
jgi:murein DD-endopeptidase MepM/ murein hydrolase activator NlpD